MDQLPYPQRPDRHASEPPKYDRPNQALGQRGGQSPWASLVGPKRWFFLLAPCDQAQPQLKDKEGEGQQVDEDQAGTEEPAELLAEGVARRRRMREGRRERLRRGDEGDCSLRVRPGNPR